MVILPTISATHNESGAIVVRMDIMFIKSLASTPKNLDMIAKADDIREVTVSIPNDSDNEVAIHKLNSFTMGTYMVSVEAPYTTKPLTVTVHVKNNNKTSAIPYEVYLERSDWIV